MTLIRRSCTVCGARAVAGSRCEDHPPGTGRHPRPCVDCGVRSDGNRCPPHQADYDEALRARQPWRARYATRTYRDARTEANVRAGGRCEDCGRSRGTICPRHRKPIRLDADHVIAIVDGGPDTAANLRIRCRCCCHAAATSTARRRRSRA